MAASFSRYPHAWLKGLRIPSGKISWNIMEAAAGKARRVRCPRTALPAVDVAGGACPRLPRLCAGGLFPTGSVRRPGFGYAGSCGEAVPLMRRDARIAGFSVCGTRGLPARISVPQR